jgi:hypothetical protein
VVTIIPFDLLAGVKGVKLLRILRLAKILKVLRASSMIQRWEHSVHITSSTKAIFKYLLLAVVMLHWIACAWALLPRLQVPQAEALGIMPETLEAALLERLEIPTLQGLPCTGCIKDDASTAEHCATPCLSRCEREVVAQLTGTAHVSFIDMNENWLCRSAELGHMPSGSLHPGGAPWDVYVSSILIAMLLLVGGVSTVLPSNTTEYAFFFLAVLVGAILFAAVQGGACVAFPTHPPPQLGAPLSLPCARSPRRAHTTYADPEGAGSHLVNLQ